MAFVALSNPPLQRLNATPVRAKVGMCRDAARWRARLLAAVVRSNATLAFTAERQVVSRIWTNMKACPRCELLNPEEGTVCACGFDLVHGDAGSVRGVLRRRGRAYQLGGLVLIAFGLAGGTAFLPIHVSVFFNIQSYRADLGMIIAGGLLLARGGRLVYRPWTEPATPKPG